MQKIKYGETEFAVTRVAALPGQNAIEITFAALPVSEAVRFFDTECDPDLLRRMEILDSSDGEEWAQAGVHVGYTKPYEVSHFDGITRVKIERELPVETRVAALSEVTELLLIRSLGGEGNV